MDKQYSELAAAIGVTRLANLTGLDRVGYPVVAAIRPITRNLSVSFGKGASVEQAKQSALMESAELHFSETPPRFFAEAAFDQLVPGSAIDPLLLEPADPAIDVRAVPMQWVQGADVLQGRQVLLPWQTISMDFSWEARRQERLVRFGATGLAASFDVAQAEAHALLEVIERDLHDCWNRSADEDKFDTLVALDQFTHPALASLQKMIADAGLSLLLWDMTGNSGVPCFLAEIMDFTPGAHTAYAQGAAAELSTTRAIGKAIGEALQVRLTYIAGSRDDLEWSDFDHRYDAMVENRRQLADPRLARRKLRFAQDIDVSPEQRRDTIVRKTSEAGAEHLVFVRLTPEDHPLAVVRAIVPGFHDLPDVDEFQQNYAPERGCLV